MTCEETQVHDGTNSRDAASTVTAAILLDARGRVLVGLRRVGKRLGGMWEFPGGKLEPGETPEACLARELAEELGVVVTVGPRIDECMHTYDFGMIRLVAFAVELVDGASTPLDHEHLDWVASADLEALAFTPTDCPLLPAIRAHAASRSRG